MLEEHPLYKKLTGDLILFPQGKQALTYNYNNWQFKIVSHRKKHWAYVEVLACNPKLATEFEDYSVKRAKVLSFTSRERNFKSVGKSSNYSEILLSSQFSHNLLNAKYPEIGIKNKCIWYNGNIKRKNDTQILKIIILLEKLTEQFDKVAQKTLHNNA